MPIPQKVCPTTRFNRCFHLRVLGALMLRSCCNTCAPPVRALLPLHSSALFISAPASVSSTMPNFRPSSPPRASTTNVSPSAVSRYKHQCRPGSSGNTATVWASGGSKKYRWCRKAVAGLASGWASASNGPVRTMPVCGWRPAVCAAQERTATHSNEAGQGTSCHTQQRHTTQASQVMWRVTSLSSHTHTAVSAQPHARTQWVGRARLLQGIKYLDNVISKRDAKQDLQSLQPVAHTFVTRHVTSLHGDGSASSSASASASLRFRLITHE